MSLQSPSTPLPSSIPERLHRSLRRSNCLPPSSSFPPSVSNTRPTGRKLPPPLPFPHPPPSPLICVTIAGETTFLSVPFAETLQLREFSWNFHSKTVFVLLSRFPFFRMLSSGCCSIPLIGRLGTVCLYRFFPPFFFPPPFQGISEKASCRSSGLTSLSFFS